MKILPGKWLESMNYIFKGAAFKFTILIWIMVQNAMHALLLRYSRVRDVPALYFTTVAVFWTEIIKFLACLIILSYEGKSNGIFGAIDLIKKQVFGQPKDTFKVCLPSMLYILQNNLFYIGASHLNAATFMIVCQLKIFTTAIFAVIMLKRSLSWPKWFALMILFIGVCLVQIQPKEEKAESNTGILSASIEQNIITGFFAVCIACILSGFSGVYFEIILKETAPISLWMRNIQMSVFGIPASLLAALAQDGQKIRVHGFMYGWDYIVWSVAVSYAIGGLSVAVCLKYSDNISKNFATSAAIILATVGSIYLFGFQPNVFFIVGAFLVILSIFLYSSSNFTKRINSYMCC